MVRTNSRPSTITGRGDIAISRREAVGLAFADESGERLAAVRPGEILIEDLIRTLALQSITAVAGALTFGISIWQVRGSGQLPMLI